MKKSDKPKPDITSMCDACSEDANSDAVETCEACGLVFCRPCYETHVTECDS